jgi:hypothetical protein
MIIPAPAGTRLTAAALSGAGTVLALSGCTPASEVAATPSASAPSSSSAAPSPSATESSASASATPTPSETESEPGALTVDITIAGGKVEPNGKKIKTAVGQNVILQVTSDEDDEIHAHTDGNGYELTVRAGQPTKGSFTIDSPGSYEVESHHLGKVIVILNVR